MSDEGFGLSEVLSAFFGAIVAFAFEWFLRWRDQGAKEQDAVNGAFLILVQYAVQLELLQKQFYDEADRKAQAKYKRPAVALEILPVVGLSEPSPKIDLASLAFLMRSHDADVVNRVLIVEAKFINAITYEINRSSAHREVQEKFSQAGVGEELRTTEEALVKIVGKPLWNGFFSLTASQREIIPDAIRDLRAVAADLADAGSLVRPSRIFLKWNDRDSTKPFARPNAAKWRYCLRALSRRIRGLEPPPKCLQPPPGPKAG
jgi:hypothetical protein